QELAPAQLHLFRPDIAAIEPLIVEGRGLGQRKDRVPPLFELHERGGRNEPRRIVQQRQSIQGRLSCLHSTEPAFQELSLFLQRRGLAIRQRLSGHPSQELEAGILFSGARGFELLQPEGSALSRQIRLSLGNEQLDLENAQRLTPWIVLLRLPERS